MTPTELAAELRQIDRAKAGARAAFHRRFWQEMIDERARRCRVPENAPILLALELTLKRIKEFK